MAKCTDCDNSCLENLADSCLVWLGASFPTLNIVKGQSYTKNIVNLATELQKIVDARVDLHCLYTNCGDPSVTIPEAVKALIDKICTLTTDDISNLSEMSCISGGVSSTEATELLGKSSMITNSGTATGSTLSYDLSEVTSGLPEGFDVQRVNVVAVGNSINGNSIIASSNNAQGILALPNQRFPVTVTIDVTVNTPAGIVKLDQSIAIVSSSTKINSPYEFNVVDYGGTGSKAKNLTTAITQMSNVICSTKTDVNALKTIAISDTENIKFPSKKRDPVIATIVGHLDSTITKLNAPGDFPLLGKICSENCGDSTIESTLQELLDSYATTICDLVSNVNTLISRINILEARVRSCCSEDSFDSNSIISGGAGTTIQGVCIGGRCG